MWALAVGLVCGVGEYMLLARLSKTLLEGGNPFVYLLLKALLLAAVLAAVFFWDKDRLMWAATGIAAPLVLITPVRYVIARLRGEAR